MIARKANRTSLIDIIILFIFIRPHFIFISDIMSVYLFDILIIFLLLISQRFIIQWRKNDSICLVLFIGSSLIKNLIVGFEYGTWLDLFKIIYYMIFLRLFLQLLRERNYSYKRLEKIIVFSFYFNTFIASVQLFDVPFLNQIVHIIYGVEKLRTLWSGYPRVYGTFYNANWFGVYIVFMIGFFTYKFCKNGNLRIYSFNSMICMYLLLICASRTAMIASVIVLIVLIFLFHKIKELVKVFSIVTVLGIVVLSIAQKSELYARTFMRFTSFFEEVHGSAGITSLAGSRYEEWKLSWPIFWSSPLLGGKIGNLLPHNSYITFLIEFGILGVIALLPIILNIAFRIKKSKKGSKYRILLAGFSIAFLVVMMSGEYLFATQIMLLELLLIAITFRYKESENV